MVAIIEQAVTGSVTGAFNIAGDGALTIAKIAALLGRSVLANDRLKSVFGYTRRGPRGRLSMSGACVAGLKTGY